MTWRMTFHPARTVGLPVYKFDQQREKCEACAHFERRVGSTGVSLTCSFAVGNHAICSVMRAPGKACGPDALGFKAREA